MSVLIKGMEMPKEGTVIVIDSTGQVWSNEWPTRGYIRLDGVTAVPVPLHGRLIDADALPINEPIRSMMVFGGEIVIAKSAIDEAPTIIQADKDGAELDKK